MADTTVTAQTVIDNSIARAKDEDKTQWTDAQLLIFLNKGFDFVHKLLIRINNELVITNDTITLLAATQEYSLATELPDFWSMVQNGVYIASLGVPLTPCTYEDKVRHKGAATATAPTAYYVTDTNIGLIGVPNAASVVLYPTLTCRYFKKNTPLTLASTMPYKNLFNEPISSFMDHLAVLKTTAPAQELTAIYNTLEEQTISIANKRTPI